MTRVGVKYTLSNTNTNTFFLNHQIQIQNTNINTLNIKSYINNPYPSRFIIINLNLIKIHLISKENQ